MTISALNILNTLANLTKDVLNAFVLNLLLPVQLERGESNGKRCANDDK